MSQFGGIVQRLESIGVVDRSNGNAVAVDSNGKIGVNSLPPVSITGAVATSPATLSPLGYQQVSVAGTAVGLTVPAGAKLALIQNDGSGNDVNWRDDGVDPTGALGMTVGKGVTFEYAGNLSAIKFIRKSASTATLNVSYYSYV